MINTCNTNKAVLPYPSLIMRILVASGYELPTENEIGERPLELKSYGYKAFDNMMNAGKHSREEGITVFDNPQTPSQTSQSLPTPTHASTSSQPPPIPPSIFQTPPPPTHPPLQRPQMPGPMIEQMTEMLERLKAHLDTRLDSMFSISTRIEQRLNNIDARVARMEDFSKDIREEVENARKATSIHLGEIEGTQTAMRSTQVEMQTRMNEMDNGQRYVWSNYFSHTLNDATTYDALCEKELRVEEKSDNNSSSDDEENNDEVVEVVSDGDTKINASQEEEKAVESGSKDDENARDGTNHAEEGKDKEPKND